MVTSRYAIYLVVKYHCDFLTIGIVIYHVDTSVWPFVRVYPHDPLLCWSD